MTPTAQAEDDSPLTDRKICEACDRRFVLETRPAPHDQEPGHVRRRSRRRDHAHRSGRPDLIRHTGGFWFGLQITLWLWFTVLFANFAEAMAEGRGKAQAETLRKARAETEARKLRSDGSH